MDEHPLFAAMRQAMNTCQSTTATLDERIIGEWPMTDEHCDALKRAVVTLQASLELLDQRLNAAAAARLLSERGFTGSEVYLW